jgi:hypothetical protein
MISRRAPWTVLTTASLLLGLICHVPAVGAAARASRAADRPAPTAQSASAAEQRGTASITITVTTEDGVAVRNARVSLIATGAAPASSATTPGGQPTVPNAPAARPGTSPASVQATTPTARDRRGASVFQRQAKTNSGGAAAFGELPAGTYAVSVSPPPGYVSRRTPPRVAVKAGGQAAATVKISRGGVITGRVLDDEGYPLMGAWVSVFRLTPGGHAQIYGASTLPTDDLGAFRVWSLPAGEYLLTANYDDRVATFSGDGAPLAGYLAAHLPGGDAGGARLETYLATHFPGVAAIDAASPVQVKAGQETGGVEIPLVRGRLGSVTARVVDSSGAAGGSGTYQFVSRGRNASVNVRGSIGPEGVVRISNVAAGDYYLWAVQRQTGPARATEVGFLPVTVDGNDVNVSLQTNTGAALSGRMVMEGNPPTQSGTTGASGQSAVKVTIRSGTDSVTSDLYFWTRDPGASDGTVRPDGTFSITGVRGPVQVGAAGGLAALKAVRRGAIDISGRPLELQGTEQLDNLVVVMTYDFGSVQGSVVDDDDEPVPGATVIVVPDDPDTWNTGSPFVRTAAAGPSTPVSAAAPGAITSGQGAEGVAGFLLPQLAPGRYLVIGVADSPVGTVDRALIEQWRGQAAAVSVDAGQTATVKIKVTK